MTLLKSKYYVLFLGLWASVLQADIINSIKSLVVPSANIETYGIWSEKQAGLGHKIWKKSNRATVEALISEPWTSFASPTLYKLGLRVLLTSTEIPAPEDGSINLLEMRAQRLYELGEITYAFELIKGFSANINPALFNKIKFAALLAQQKYAEALQLALAQAPKSHEVFWQEAILFCQLMDPTQHEVAQLSLSLYRDNPKIADPEIVLLADHILGKHKLNVPVSSTNSFMKLLLRLRAGLLPDSLISMVSPRYLSLLHTYPDFAKLPLVTRVRIQEKMTLYVAPAYGSTVLQTVYADASSQAPCPFNSATDPIGEDPVLQEDSPLVRAHLFQLLSSAPTPLKKTVYATLLLQNAHKHKLFVPIAHLVAPFLKDLDTKNTMVQPYLLLAHAITHQKPALEPTSSNIEDPVLLTTLVLHYPEDRWDQLLWQHKTILENSPHKHILVGIVYPWQKVLGQKLGLLLWKHQVDFDPEIFKAPFLANFLLEDARLRKQIGEVVLLTLLLSTYEDKSKNVGSFPAMVRGLYRVGLQQEALDLAMEKLLSLVSLPTLSLANPPVIKPIVSVKPAKAIKETVQTAAVQTHVPKPTS